MNSIISQLRLAGVPMAANDNLSEAVKPESLFAIQKKTEENVRQLLADLLIDCDNDPNTRDTPRRVAKMFVQEVFKGRYQPRPDLTTFPNTKNVNELYKLGPITVRSACSHHLVPIVGKAWIGVIPGKTLIGISKFHRLVEWVCARPQIQEEMTKQIADAIEEACKPKALAVVVDATHMCMTWRGVRESMDSSMTTSDMRGYFRDDSGPGFAARAEFLSFVQADLKK